MTSFKKDIPDEYKKGINRVFQYIDENLDANLSLEVLAKVALFSPFHFHRIFKFITKETLNEYVTRRRIEKAALDLLHKNLSITEIAYTYGFSENSSFTRTFKKFYGVSPTAFRKQNTNRFSKIRQLESKNGQACPDYKEYLCVIDKLKTWIKMNTKIEIKETPKMDLAYVSAIGSQNLESAFTELIQWATPQGLMNEETIMLTVYHDSFKVTEANKVRMNACILLNAPIEKSEKVEQTSIEAGKCIVGSFEIQPHEFEKSWTSLFIWMNENGYKKAGNNAFELYHNNFNEHPEQKSIVDFYIPIE